MWQFTIKDFTSGTEVDTVIQEPVGWDAITLTLKRDTKWKGFFSFEDNSFSSLQFWGDGADILRNAYYQYGVDAEVKLQVGYACADNDAFDNLYLGSFDFTTFKDYIGDKCYVECATVVTDSLFLFRQRADQEVDLDSLSSYDQLPVTQTANAKANFQHGTNQIEVDQLLNGLEPGSKIVITGSTMGNNGTFTVASAKPDYTNVNPDVPTGGSIVSSLTATVAFDPNIKTLSVNPKVSIAVGSTVTIIAPAIPFTGGHYDNSGSYEVIAVQQFFNYTRLTIGTIAISDTTAANYPASMVTQYDNTVVINGTFTTTNKPTSTIIQVAENLTDENGASITITADWLKNNLKPYTGLGQIITIPPKEIIATSLWKATTDIIVDPKIYPDPHSGTPGGSTYVVSFISPSIPDILHDIDETFTGTGTAVLTNFDTTPPDTWIYFKPQSLPCSGFASLKINLNWQLIPYDGGDPFGYDSYVSVTIAKASDPATFHSSHVIIYSNFGSATHIDPTMLPMTNTVNFNAVVNDVEFNPGEYLFIYFNVTVNNPSNSYYPKFLLAADSTIEFKIASTCVNTPCSVYMINEAASRCVESYTNDKMRVYSDYFGRQNAQPYTSAEDGCGGLEAITNGLRIRGCIMPDSSSIPKYTTSIKDIFDGLDAIHNIGMGMEPDGNRSGYNLIRIEPFEYFFQNTVLKTCDSVMKYEREQNPDMLAGSLSIGYQQFETWNNNGLYDIFGNRKYRTPLTWVNRMVDKTCRWMASDYAIEFTRREFGLTTSDSRYDSNTFILCLTNKYKGIVYFTPGNCLIMSPPDGTPMTGFFHTGDSLSIYDTGSNNITITVTNVLYMGLYTFVYFGYGINTEYAPVTRVHNNTTSSEIIRPAIFVNGNGAALLFSESLFEAIDGDLITFSNTTSNNFTIAAKTIFTDELSNDDPLNQKYFPQTIIPASAPPFTAETAASTIVNDSTNIFYQVEQGVEQGTNLLSPRTVMNYRISPAHNAMRHYRNVITDRDFSEQMLIFTGGEGNFYALGKLSDDCSPENGLISEGGNLSKDNFTNVNDSKPLFYPETVKFEYPLTWAEFISIQNNPYGLIEFQHGNEATKQGWIAELQYKPYTGLAEFTLYPKIS